MPGRVTIYDVARAAGVAASTVSRAFTRPDRVAADTAERIRRVASEIGYRAEPVVGAPTAHHTATIAVTTTDITNPYYSELIRGAQAAAAKRGYATVLVDTQESVHRERAGLDRALASVDGLVLASTRLTDPAIRMLAKQRAVVVVNRSVADVSSVMTDHAMSARQVVEHLAGLGHRSLTFLAGPQAAWSAGVRWRELRTCATAVGITARRLGPYPPTAAAGSAAVEAFRARPTTAVVAYNDLMALGFLRGAVAAGLAVPEDVSVAGFDNIFVDELVRPSLTSVAPPLRALGATAAGNVIALARGARSSVQPAALPTRLFARESTAPPR